MEYVVFVLMTYIKISDADGNKDAEIYRSDRLDIRMFDEAVVYQIVYFHCSSNLINVFDKTNLEYSVGWSQ